MEIHKGGSNAQIHGYQPLNLTCILCRGLEKPIRDHTWNRLKDNLLIRTTDHGFLKDKFSLKCVKFLEVTSQLDEEKTVEFSKDFDSVNLRLPFSKMQVFAVHNQLHQWIADEERELWCIASHRRCP